MNNKTVFILGAGFTKAFCSNAPLLNWDITTLYDELDKKYKDFPNIRRVLLTYSHGNPTYRTINIESLLSRLYSSIPYDGVFLGDGERKILFDDFFNHFLKVLKNIKIDPKEKTTLDMFAKFVIEKRITCITFNYDIILDKALYDYKKSINILEAKYWNPEGGYGFFCKPSDTLVREGFGVIKDSTNWLLKLHGSLNWRIKRGFQTPYPLDAIIHEEDWNTNPIISPEDVAIHRESNPFVVPPVLDKTALSEQPILRVVWENAYNKLEDATNVIFLGYSLPKTDISAMFLFTDGLKNMDRKQINIVNINRNSGKNEKKINVYKELFPTIKKSQFNFDGVSKWIINNCKI